MLFPHLKQGSLHKCSSQELILSQGSRGDKNRARLHDCMVEGGEGKGWALHICSMLCLFYLDEGGGRMVRSSQGKGEQESSAPFAATAAGGAGGCMGRGHKESP